MRERHTQTETDRQTERGTETERDREKIDKGSYT